MSGEEAFRAGGHVAFVIGYTGEVGKQIVKELAARDIFSKVILIGRRDGPLPEGLSADKFVLKTVDFDRISEFGEAFKGADVGYCALGTTRGKSGVEGFIKVDHDYVVNSATVAKSVGCKHFNLVTSAGSTASSPMLYPKTKGRAEDDCKALGFERLSIYRPAFLLCQREGGSRPTEKLAKLVLAPIFYALPTAISIPTTSVARAMVNNTVAAAAPSTTVEVLENAQLHKLAGQK